MTRGLFNYQNINYQSSAFYQAASQTSLQIGVEVASSELSNGVLGRQTFGCWQLACMPSRLTESMLVCNVWAKQQRKSVSYPRVGSPNVPFSCSSDSGAYLTFQNRLTTIRVVVHCTGPEIPGVERCVEICLGGIQCYGTAIQWYPPSLADSDPVAQPWPFWSVAECQDTG
jgi:hypothetical protein